MSNDNGSNRRLWFGRIALIALLGLASCGLYAADFHAPGIDISIAGGGKNSADVPAAMKIVAVLTVLSLAPAILIMMTSFTRIIIVLTMLRHALGMQDTPPNTVLISLALFLTLFTMLPVMTQIDNTALKPYLDGKLAADKALKDGMQPLKEFMIRQTREQDLSLMLEVSNSKVPDSIRDIDNTQLLPAFMLSELKTAFQIGFVIFLPFLLVDIVVSGVLMSMGMMMVPPMMISLPIKVLMFVLIDGWNLVVRSLLESFH